MDSLQNLPLAYASVSIGYKDEHTLPKKLDAIANAGFQAIELGMPDLVAFANQHLKTGQQGGSKGIGDHDFDDLVSIGKLLKTMLDAKRLKVFMMQPFANFEGWLEASPERKDAWERVEGWTSVMEAVGCDMLQVGSSDSPEEKIGKDRGRFVKDLRELADKLAQKNMRVAYENWCWSTHAPDWADVWDICQKVDRPNFGLCLDTFQSAGGEWGDPTTKSGILEDGRTPERVEADWKKSCNRLATTVPKDKIYLLQISDAYKVNQPPVGPLEKKEIDGLRPRGRWSHDFRPLPFEGYLPVVDFTKAVLDTGFRDWFSYEVFELRAPDGKPKEYDIHDFAKQAMNTQKRLVEAVAKAS
ncbi:3-dehydroshikimate dehydratase [Fulvia fulva]|uniref:3-dehydroshikimate dehydratase n=1 Tax=Passalora fulva TaxID=5499 RepID=A0A9Q8LEQ6_PASFU|nr:3-dehydroshikimate dehydratase [Fulvia fulva]KAK4616269.1 3-dehydroshikimate dehydratase [Fulvia fulva]KAK4616594.1 3-dehydroshikimate dehydratase [Fulvia fulva]UJO15864.1 3-dehydroshikimate dehydratase [Fulvia fulva]WPV18881.1 3-dehydroshikimate dehydratase [Fulvia fulva]WPV34472.1 3-dehydroshikimate dehydratase [Fulvia fulva]